MTYHGTTARPPFDDGWRAGVWRVWLQELGWCWFLLVEQGAGIQ